jgi:hypothetical protein
MLIVLISWQDFLAAIVDSVLKDQVWGYQRVFGQISTVCRMYSRIHSCMVWPVIVTLLGFALLVRATRDRLKSNRARSWPTAQGTVLESRLREVRDSDGSTWEVYILYEYPVNGVSYRSDVWRLQAGSSSFTETAKKTVASYPIGSVVTVHFNPEAPADAILEPGKMTWWMFFGGASFFIVGVIAFIRNVYPN